MKTLKTLLLLFSIATLLFSFTGCDTMLMSTEDRETYNTTVKKGEEIVKEYVEENMPDYKVEKTICVQDEPAGSLYGEPSIYSSTTCVNKKNNLIINILCNTETGELFSDEHVKEVEEELIEYFENIINCEEYKKKFSIFPKDECSWLNYASVLMLEDTTLEDVLNNENYSLTLRMYFFDADVEKIHSIPDTFAEECKINELDIQIITTKDKEYYNECLYSSSIWDPYDGGKIICRTFKNNECVVESKNIYKNENTR